MKTKKITAVQRFWMLLKPDKLEIRNIYGYAIFIGLINLSLPIGIQAIINLIQGGAVSTSWIVLIIFVVAGIVIGGVLQIQQIRITENLQQKIFARAAFEFVYRMPRIRLEQLYKKYAPELMNRFFDIVSVQKALPKILIDFSSASIQVLFGLILLSLYHPFFILFSLFLIGIVLLIVRMTAKRGLETSLDESKRKYEIAHTLQEVAKANYTFKMAGTTNLPLENVNEKTGGYLKARESHFKVLLQQYGLMVAFKAVVALGLLLMGGLLVIEQQMNIGQFVAAEIIILLVINAVEKMIMSFETIYDVLTSLEKIAQVTDLELDEAAGIDVNGETEGMSVRISNVAFHYPEETRMVIRDADFEIKAGDSVLISGENDSGKSTLLSLIGGLYLPVQGTVSIDDVPLQNYQSELLRSRIGGHFRDETLFEGTLIENITLGRERATFDNVRWAVESLGLKSLINQLPLGYDTPIIPQGRQFSKSTIARIVLARAIADKPRLLLLENSFSVFAEKDRLEIVSFLTDKQHPWTLIMTSSESLSLSQFIDQEIRMNQGQIIEIRK